MSSCPPPPIYLLYYPPSLSFSLIHSPKMLSIISINPLTSPIPNKETERERERGGNTTIDRMESLNPSVLQWQQQQQGYNNVDQSFHSLQNECFGWPNRTTHCNIREEEMGTAGAVSNSRTSSADRVATTARENKGTCKKRKTHADKSPMVEGDDQQAKNRHGIERREASEESSKEKDEKKLDYIHVRARRGQATDSHSLAERVRRERISERMKYLQGLVPGCNKITGKAGMLDEIINYVQSLQKQVEFLSMKLATVSPRPDLNMESFFNKEINLGGDLAISAFGMSSNLIDPSYVQSNFLQQLANCCGYDIAMNPSAELALRRNMSTPMSSPETFSDSCFNVPRPSTGLDNELHSLYGVEFHQGRSPTFSFHSLQGNLLPNNPKMEM